MGRIKVLHPITRLIIGGAQENTMLTADYHTHLEEFGGRYQVDVVSGPQTGPEGSLIEEVRRRGVQLTIMPELRREISPANDLRAIWKLRRLMRDEQGRPAYDIVHTHSSKAGLLGRIAATWAGVPTIVHTVHGWSFHDQMSPSRKRLYVMLEQLGARYGQAMITVSPRDIEKGVAVGIGRPADYTVIRSGIELDRFGHPQVSPAEMRQQLGIPQEAVVIGSVTRLSPQKAPLDLIEALRLVAPQRPDVWFVIVGDGPLRDQVEQRATDCGIRSRLVMTGLRRDVPELMALFDIFVLSSLWEGLPRVLPQAMATGLPIICTQADGSAEAVIDGRNGYLVPRADTAEMSRRLIQLIDDPELRHQLGAAGTQMADTFGARQMVRDIDALYQRLRSSANGRSEMGR